MPLGLDGRVFSAPAHLCADPIHVFGVPGLCAVCWHHPLLSSDAINISGEGAYLHRRPKISDVTVTTGASHFMKEDKLAMAGSQAKALSGKISVVFLLHQL